MVHLLAVEAGLAAKGARIKAVGAVQKLRET
jgi:hypothetical protein